MLFPNSYTVNNMNFNPSMIKSHNGIFFDNIIEELSYLFTQNEKVTMDDKIEVIDENGNFEYDESGNKNIESTGIVSSYYFWLQNRLQLYERVYKRLQDTLSSIGGISRAVFVVVVFINSIVSNYIILLDTEELYLSLNKEKKIIKSEPFNKDKKILCTPKRHYYCNNNNRVNHPSNFERMMKEDVEIFNFQSENDRIMRNKNLKRNNLVNNPFEPSRLVNQNEIIIDNKQINKRIKFDKYQKDKRKQYNNNLNKTDNDKNEGDVKSKKGNSFSFWKYLKYIILCCKRNNSDISFYEDYRAKYISEEEIIHSHLNLSLLINSYKLA